MVVSESDNMISRFKLESLDTNTIGWGMGRSLLFCTWKPFTSFIVPAPLEQGGIYRALMSGCLVDEWTKYKNVYIAIARKRKQTDTPANQTKMRPRSMLIPVYNCDSGEFIQFNFCMIVCILYSFHFAWVTNRNIAQPPVPLQVQEEIIDDLR